MCGITGFIKARASDAFSDKELAFLEKTHHHRGPDSGGTYMDTGVGMGHRRLSIIDLTSAGDQPMYSRGGRYLITYNGEIYNRTQLVREHLEGFPFITRTDTELVLELFSLYGVRAFSLLNGMFALCIYDTLSKEMTLARDPAGIKPLYYYIKDNCFIFGSEIKSIRPLLSDIKLSHQAISEFLHLGYIPAPNTIFENVYKFTAGSYVQVKQQETDIIVGNFHSFYSFAGAVRKNTLKDELSAKKELRDILFDVVDRQLEADLPCGIFLSGGIDSTLLTAIAAQVSPKKIKTFTIGIQQNGLNEAPYASKIASVLATEHHEIEFSENAFLDTLEDFLNVYDEPFGDTSAFPTLMISKLAVKQVAVALSGDGADELFLGYGNYRWAERLARPPLKALRHPIFYGSRMLPPYFRHAGKMFAYRGYHSVRSHIAGRDNFCEYELKKALKENQFDFSILNSRYSSERKLRPAEQQSLWDLSHYLQDDLLVKLDRASMSHSLEVRVPFLDMNVVNWALNLDQSLKLRHGSYKYILKKLLADFIPMRYFDRRKQGFSIPLEQLMRNGLRPLIDKYFTKPVLERHGILKPEYALNIKKSFFAGHSIPFFQVWLITVLHWWLEEQFGESAG